MEIGLAGPGIGVDVFWDGFVSVVMVQLAFNGTGKCQGIPRRGPSLARSWPSPRREVNGSGFKYNV